MTTSSKTNKSRKDKKELLKKDIENCFSDWRISFYAKDFPNKEYCIFQGSWDATIDNFVDYIIKNKLK